MKNQEIKLKTINHKYSIIIGKNTLRVLPQKIYFNRKRIYNEADFRIKCNSLKSEEIVNKILNLYEKSGN